jgi:predicted nucleotidyltransferase component of viral defense system
MASSPRALTPAQEQLIRAFFAHAEGFFLTGGSALAGYYLHHRTSADLDFFTASDETFRHGRRFLAAAVHDIGATMEVVREYPGFAELQAIVGGERIRVDLVHDTSPQVKSEKLLVEGAVVDTLEDIGANKICAIVGRSEIRDYIDLFFLERAGQRPQEAIARAQEKDPGVEPATLAWVLGQVRVNAIPSTVLLPLAPGELQAFVDRLAAELARGAYPQRKG